MAYVPSSTKDLLYVVCWPDDTEKELKLKILDHYIKYPRGNEGDVDGGDI